MKLRILAHLPLLLVALPVAAQQRVTVCHAPPNDPRALRTVEVRSDMLRLHIAHGDTLGPCGCQSDDVCPEGTFCESPRGICGGRGRCRVLSDPCPCPRAEAPVCGCDGRTYGNSCEARCAGVSVLNPSGACCSSSLDCRPVRTRCGQCGCIAAPLAAPEPSCEPGEAVACAADPCREATAVCSDGECVTASGVCGGPEGFLCPGDRTCIDDPRDQCDPIFGENCPGVCAEPPAGAVLAPTFDLDDVAKPASGPTPTDAVEVSPAPLAE